MIKTAMQLKALGEPAIWIRMYKKMTAKHSPRRKTYESK